MKGLQILPSFMELMDYHWIYNRLKITNAYELVKYYDAVIKSGGEGLAELSLLKTALDMSLDIIHNDPEQLSSQLYGRLMGSKGRYLKVDDLLNQIWNLPKADLLPLHPTLEQAGNMSSKMDDGHTDKVSSVALSGEFAVSASHDRTLKVWNWTTGEVIHTIIGHYDKINAVALSGDFAVSASGQFMGVDSEKILKVWNWKTRKPIRTLVGHTAGVITVALSGEFAVSASFDNTLKVWNWTTGEEIRTLFGHSYTISYIALSGSYVAAASYDETLKVWNWTTGELLEDLPWTMEKNFEVRDKYNDGLLLGGLRNIDDTLRFLNGGNYVVMYYKMDDLLAKFSSYNLMCVHAENESMIVASETSGRLHFLHVKPPPEFPA